MSPDDLKQICQQITQPIFFITPDINWAIGLETLLPNYHIICWENHPLVNLVEKSCPVLCLQRDLPKVDVAKNTGSMLGLKEVQLFIAHHSRGTRPAVMYFKPSPKLDKLCDELGFLQVSNRADLSRKFDDKLVLVELSQQHPKLQVVPGIVASLQELTIEHRPHPALLLQGEGTQVRNVILNSEIRPPLLIGEGQGEVKREQGQGWVFQFSRGWAGRSTFLIKTEADLHKLQQTAGDQLVKVTPFLHGHTYINNACVLPDGTVLHSPPAQQITRPHPEFSSLPFATCGRQWPADLNQSSVTATNTITDQVGKVLFNQGYRGYFGLDFLVGDSTGQVYLLEINPRLTASSSFYTQLELIADLPPLLLFHLLSFLPNQNLIQESTISRNEKRETPKRNITGIQLLLRNHLPESVTIRQSFSSGIYARDNLTSAGFIKLAYRIEELRDHQVLLKVHNTGTEISPESELFSLETLQPLLQNQQLSDSLVKQLLSLKHSLT